MKGDENKKKFLKQTLEFLLEPNNQYTLTKKDHKFMEDNRNYYEPIVKELQSKAKQGQLI